MTSIVTYHSTNAKPNEAWLAYVVLPSGEQWLVRFAASTEAAAAEAAKARWESEQKRYAPVSAVYDDSFAKDAAIINGRGAHFAGKLWVIHQTTRELKRIDPSELDSHLGAGYVRGGPRSK